MTDEMTFEELQAVADAAMSEALTNSDFRRIAAGTWNRRRGDELNVIQLQEHSTKEFFCVNLGVHYTFLPKAGTDASLDVDRVELPDCELKLRLTDQAGASDRWWPIAASSVGQVADLVCSRGLPRFNAYGLDGPIAAMDGTSIESGDSGLLASMTRVRACLLLARMHEHFGNRDKSVETAKVGIRLAGMAVGPKKALKEILRRAGDLA